MYMYITCRRITSQVTHRNHSYLHIINSNLHFKEMTITSTEYTLGLCELQVVRQTQKISSLKISPLNKSTSNLRNIFGAKHDCFCTWGPELSIQGNFIQLDVQCLFCVLIHHLLVYSSTPHNLLFGYAKSKQEVHIFTRCGRYIESRNWARFALFFLVLRFCLYPRHAHFEIMFSVNTCPIFNLQGFKFLRNLRDMAFLMFSYVICDIVSTVLSSKQEKFNTFGRRLRKQAI